MFSAFLLLAAVFAAGEGEPAPAPTDDEARIEELMAFEIFAREASAREAEDTRAAAEQEKLAAAGKFPPPAGTAIAFDDLPKMVGYPVRVHIGGRSRIGSVEQADRKTLTLRAQMGGGYAQFKLTRNQIAAIEAM